MAITYDIPIEVEHNGELPENSLAAYPEEAIDLGFAIS